MGNLDRITKFARGIYWKQGHKYIWHQVYEPKFKSINLERRDLPPVDDFHQLAQTGIPQFHQFVGPS